MKKLLILIALINLGLTQAQIVNIPDPVFKNYLLTHNNPVIDTNDDNEIQISEALAYSNDLNYYLPTVDENTEIIRDLTGIEEFVNATSIYFYNISLSNQIDLLINNFNNLNYIEINVVGGDTFNINVNLSNNPLLDIVRIFPTQTADNLESNMTISNLNLTNSNNITILVVIDCKLTSLSLNNLTNLQQLYCSSNYLNTLNVSNNNNLIQLFCDNNILNEINLSNHPDLKTFNCNDNPLNNLDLSNATTLTYLDCVNTTIETLDLSSNPDLNHLDCSNNSLSTLDVSANNIDYLRCENNSDLVYLILKNVLSETLPLSYFQSNFHLENLPNLQSVCVMELNTNLTTHIIDQVNHSVTFMTDCNFELQTNTIQGSVNLDMDNNDCDVNDISLHNVLVTTNNGINTFGTFILEDASYSIFTNEGDFNTTITPNLPSYFTVNPNTQTNTFTGFDNSFTADFCITPNQVVNDVNISIAPISQARPGFNSTYKIVYKNVGTTQLNGSVTLDFDATKLSFLNASETTISQTNNSLTFNYSNLNPFETRTINLEFNVSAPPITTIDDVLNFTATINPIYSDYTTNDNVFHLSQTIVDSFDPNDINILEGESIKIQHVNQYLHYVIRFQNTGTASAINIVVTNKLDANLDWSTLELVNTSHPTRVAISNGNDMEFIFENINLPDKNTDEVNSQGYIIYKIKPISNIEVNNTINNQAKIYFDFNDAIATNIAKTTFIADTNSINDTILETINIYPNPAKNIIQIETTATIKTVFIYNYTGQLIIESSSKLIDISKLNHGVYLLKLTDANGNFAIRKIWKTPNN